jgi:hypothetical protein
MRELAYAEARELIDLVDFGRLYTVDGVYATVPSLVSFSSSCYNRPRVPKYTTRDNNNEGEHPSLSIEHTNM